MATYTDQQQRELDQASGAEMDKLGKPTVHTQFFEFIQNNSGGHFDIDDDRGIGPRVWIEAVDLDHVLSRAPSIGIYFNGVDDGVDCGCCGDRWSHPWGDGQPSPKVNEDYDFGWHDTVYVHRMGGTIERLHRQSKAGASQ